MIEAGKSKGVLSVKLPSDATIGSVEEDTDRLKKAVDAKGIREAEVDCSQVEEVDTSYLQLLLALCRTLRAKGIAIKVRGEERLGSLLQLYGLTAGEVFWAGLPALAGSASASEEIEGRSVAMSDGTNGTNGTYRTYESHQSHQSQNPGGQGDAFAKRVQQEAHNA